MAKGLLSVLLSGLLLLGACSEIDCPLDNVVVSTCNLYAADTQKSLTLSATLTVTAEGTDSVLLNQATGISTFALPVCHTTAADTLLFQFDYTDGTTVLDTLYVSHTNEPHYESLDCPATVFHTLTSVRWTSNAVDSVAIVRSTVNYDDIENLQIYLSSAVQ